MKELKFTTKEQPYTHYGMKSYRIEVDLTNKHNPLQRHIWTDSDGVVEIGEWILTSYDLPELLIKRGYKPITRRC